VNKLQVILTTMAVAMALSRDVVAQVVASLDVIPNSVVVGEPILARLRISNRGALPVQVRAPKDFANGVSAFFALSYNVGPFEGVPTVRTDPSGRSVALGPGESLIVEELFGAGYSKGSLKPLLDLPGSYRLQVSMGPSSLDMGNVYGGARGPAVVAVSSPVVVQVPPDRATNDVVAKIRDPDVLDALLHGLPTGYGVPQQERIELRQSMNERLITIAQSSTPFAPYAALSLAQSAANSEEFGSQPQGARVRETDAETELFKLLQVADQEGFVLRSRVIRLRAAVLRRLGDDAAATAEGERLLREFPESAAAREWREIEASLPEARANVFSMKEAPPFDDVSRGLEGIVLSFVREIPNGFVALGTSDILADDGEFNGRSKGDWLVMLRDEARAGPPPDRRRGMNPLFIWSERLDRQRAITTLAIEQFSRAQGRWETALLRVSVGWSGGSWRITRLERIGDEQPH